MPLRVNKEYILQKKIYAERLTKLSIASLTTRMDRGPGQKGLGKGRVVTVVL